MRRITIVAAVSCLIVVGGTFSVVAARTAAGPPLIERVKVGAYVHLDGRPNRDPVAPRDLAYLENRIGELDVIHYFFSWGRSFHDAVTANLNRRELMLSMKPDGRLIWEINSGLQDAYIDRFATEARNFAKPVYLRFGHEMNGRRMSYSAGSAGGPAASEFRAAWRHLVERFRAQGAANVKFIWSPNESDYPDVAGNHLEDYWPGQEYVDILGFDAYNWTNAEPRRGDGADRSFEEIVEDPYQRISDLAPSKDVWLCEFGTTEPGKAAWIREMFASTRFPRLTGLIYFSENDQRDVQRDWRLDSSAEAAAAWREAVTSRAPAPRP